VRSCVIIVDGGHIFFVRCGSFRQKGFILFIRVKKSPNSPRVSVQIVENHRVGNRVKQKTVRYVGVAMDDAEEQQLRHLAQDIIVKLSAQKEQQGDLFDDSASLPKARNVGRPPQKRIEDVLPVEQVTLDKIVEECRIVEGIDEIGTAAFNDIGYDNLFKNKRDNALLRDIVLARLSRAASKHKTQSILANDFGKLHSLDSIYRLMDKVYEKIDDIKKTTFEKTLSLFKEGIEVLLFDVTTLYFESVETDELREFGYSKDHRFNTTQVVLALATNSEGLPIGYELFEGNRAEVKTLIAAIEKWRGLFSIQSVCFVGDRAMFSEANLQLLENHQFTYVVAAKLRGLPASLRKEILDEDNYRMAFLKEELAWVGEFDCKGRRLITSYKTRRAERDNKKREEVVDKIRKQLGASKGNTKRVISNQGVKKFTTTENAQTTVDLNKIALDAQWDGMHGVITNIKDACLSDILSKYANLWIIEDAFRTNKNLLKMRPIFHWKPERIHAHIALCYMTFSVLKHIHYRVGLMGKLSPEKIIEALNSVQATIFVHKTTNDKYRVPGRFTHEARKIYKAYDVSRPLDATPYL
jgi:transposase